MPGTVFIALMLSFIAAAGHCAPAAKELDGYVINQACRLTGDCDLLVSKAGARLTYRKTGVVNLFVPPYKEIICFNPATRTICRAPAAKFTNFAGKSMAMFTFTIEDAQLEPAGKVKKFGFQLQKLVTTKAYEFSQAAKRSRNELSASAPASLFILGATAPDITSEPRLGLFLQRAHCLPPCNLFPLEVESRSMAKGMIHYLVTKQVKADRIAAANFSVPQGYRPVKNMQALLETDSSEAAIQMIVP